MNYCHVSRSVEWWIAMKWLEVTGSISYYRSKYENLKNATLIQTVAVIIFVFLCLYDMYALIGIHTFMWRTINLCPFNTYVIFIAIHYNPKNLIQAKWRRNTTLLCVSCNTWDGLPVDYQGPHRLSNKTIFSSSLDSSSTTPRQSILLLACNVWLLTSGRYVCLKNGWG